MLNITTIPSQSPVYPVTLDQLKTQCRIELDFTHEDDLLNEMIETATSEAELYLNRATISKQHKWVLDAWPEGDSVELPRPPLVSVESVVYHTRDQSGITLSDASYFVDTVGGRLCLNDGESWPSDPLRSVAGIEITFTAGYGPAAADVPAPIRSAIKMIAADLYENREGSVVGAGVTSSANQFGPHALLDKLRYKKY